LKVVGDGQQVSVAGQVVRIDPGGGDLDAPDHRPDHPSTLDHAPHMVDVHQAHYRREHVEEVLHAVDVATAGVVDQPPINVPIHEVHDRRGQVVRHPVVADQPLRGNVGVERVTETQAELAANRQSAAAVIELDP